MDMKSTQKDGGYIVKIILIIIALIAVKYYFHFDFVEWVKSDQGQKIIQPAWTAIKNLYSWIDGLFRSHAA